MLEHTKLFSKGGCMYDICLISMPYEQLRLPSIGISLLVAGAKEAGLSATAIYPRFWFAERIGLAPYEAIARQIDSSLLLGEWTFSGAAFPNFNPDYEAFSQERMHESSHILEAYHDILGKNVDIFKIFSEVRQAANSFVIEAAERILKYSPQIVGCSSTFQQHCASLALVRKIKELNPSIITLIGGANCEGTMGKATQRAFPWIDFTVSGEADLLFPEFCRTLLEKGKNVSLEELPHGVYSIKNSFETTPVNKKPLSATVRQLDMLPVPDYDDYFEELEKFAYKDRVYPALHMETSRGCWWGQCTFCGMNGERQQFQSKSPESALRELQTLCKRYSINKFSMTDCILDMRYFKSVIPDLAFQKPSPYLLVYAVTSNLNERHIKLLSAAGVRMIQPGIESLHDKVLKLINKGNSAIHNVALLKFAVENGIVVIWNFLYGIPGEKDVWYEEMASWLPMIFHLQPPSKLSSLGYVRFSHYHRHPERFGLVLSPSKAFSYIYPLSAKDMEDIAYLFEDINDPKHGQINKLGIQTINDIVLEWKNIFSSYPSEDKRVRLTVRDDGMQSLITDTRPCAKEKNTILQGLSHLVYRECRSPRNKDALLHRLQRTTGLKIETDELDKIIEDLLEKRLMLSLNGKLLSLALLEPQLPLLSKREFMTGCDVFSNTLFDKIQVIKTILTL